MKNKIVILLFNLPWDWPADYARQTAMEVSNKYKTVCYLGIDTIPLTRVLTGKDKVFKRENTSLWTFRPFSFPFKRFKTVQRMETITNLYLLRLLIALCISQEKGYIVWIFDQFYTSLLQFIPRSWDILYDCVDLAWDPNPVINDQIKKNETTLIHAARWMVVNSHVLAKIHENERQDIHLVPLGFRSEKFKDFSVFPKNRISSSPNIGFVGVIDYRLDYQLLFNLARKHPTWKFIFQGKISFDYNQDDSIRPWINKLESLSNVAFRPPVVVNYIPQIIAGFDICIIPYRVDFDINRYCYPMKIFEYFYMGKPVISTPIEELKQFRQYIRIGTSEKEWKNHIQSMLSHTRPHHDQIAQRKLALAHTWEQKIRSISQIISREPLPR